MTRHINSFGFDFHCTDEVPHGIAHYSELEDHVGHDVYLQEVHYWLTNSVIGIELRCKDCEDKGDPLLLDVDNPFEDRICRVCRNAWRPEKGEPCEACGTVGKLSESAFYSLYSPQSHEYQRVARNSRTKTELQMKLMDHLCAGRENEQAERRRLWKLSPDEIASSVGLRVEGHSDRLPEEAQRKDAADGASASSESGA